MYLSLGYLFSGRAVIGGIPMDSDTEQIARQLFLPYWFWGATLSLISIILLVQSLRAAYGRRVKPRTTVAETTHA